MSTRKKHGNRRLWIVSRLSVDIYYWSVWTKSVLFGFYSYNYSEKSIFSETQSVHKIIISNHNLFIVFQDILENGFLKLVLLHKSTLNIPSIYENLTFFDNI